MRQVIWPHHLPSPEMIKYMVTFLLIFACHLDRCLGRFMCYTTDVQFPMQKRGVKKIFYSAQVGSPGTAAHTEVPLDTDNCFHGNNWLRASIALWRGLLWRHAVRSRLQSSSAWLESFKCQTLSQKNHLIPYHEANICGIKARTHDRAR